MNWRIATGGMPSTTTRRGLCIFCITMSGGWIAGDSGLLLTHVWLWVARRCGWSLIPSIHRKIDMSKQHFNRMPHVNFIMMLRRQGLAPWQIALWDRTWTTQYVTRAIEARVRVDGKNFAPLPQVGRPTKEQWMSHQYRYICGKEYQCLRCKRSGEKEEVDKIQCIAVEDEYKSRIRKNRKDA